MDAVGARDPGLPQRPARDHHAAGPTRERDGLAGAYAPGLSFRPRLGADAAIRAARADGDATIGAAQQGDSASLTLFATGRGTRLAWRTFTWPSTHQLNLSVVDAITGAVLYRQSLTRDATGTATAWEFYPSDIVPAGANSANPVTFPVKDGTSLFGDNAWVYADVNDNNRANAGEEIPAVTGTDWSRPALLEHEDGSQNCTTARPCTWDSRRRSVGRRTWRRTAHRSCTT